jgi:hypothetical protein
MTSKECDMLCLSGTQEYHATIYLLWTWSCGKNVYPAQWDTQQLT